MKLKYLVMIGLVVLLLFCGPVHTKADEPVLFEDQERIQTLLEDSVVYWATVPVSEWDPNIVKYIEPCFDEDDVIDLAKLVWAEAGGLCDTECACVVWAVVNRVDEWGGTIHRTIRVPNQYAFYEWMDVYEHTYELCEDVLYRWSLEHMGFTDVGRVLPPGYIYWNGDGAHNYFRDEYISTNEWDYSLPSPYESQ